MTTIQEQQISRSGSPRLDDLPAEVLRRICEYTLPQGLELSFREDTTAAEVQSPWRLFAEEPNEVPIRVHLLQYLRICEDSGCVCMTFYTKRMQTGLLKVNKYIRAEARGKSLAQHCRPTTPC